MMLDDSKKQINTMNDDDVQAISEIIRELDKCRDDDQNGENQILQVISTVGAILSIFFGVTFMNKNMEIPFVSMILSDLILCTAITYITALGIKNVLRYHYMRHLEDVISIQILRRREMFVHWMSLSTIITTRNPKNKKRTLYTYLHYSSYTMATLCAIFFCIVITLVQFSNLLAAKQKDISDVSEREKILIEYLYDTNVVYLLLLVPLGVMIFSIISYFIGSVKASKMYDIALKMAMENRENRLRLSELKKNMRTYKKQLRRKDVLSVVGYFVYPKRKDIQKAFMLLLGFWTGVFLEHKKLNFALMQDRFADMLIVLVVIDILVYQARYQWNDIRGIKEDIQARKKDRLPVGVLGVKNAIRISTITMISKCILACFITEIYGGEMKFFLWISIIIILIITVLYETASKYKFSKGIFVLVCFGYPIRFFTGIWSAWPEVCREHGVIILLLLFAYAFFGEYSVLFTWIHEVLVQKINKGFIKPHYIFLFNCIKKRYNGTENKRHILNEKGVIIDPWNICYLLSVLCLSLILLFQKFSIVLVFIELILLVMLAISCCEAIQKSRLICIASAGMTLIKTVVCFGSLCWEPICICVGMSQMMFILMYLLLRFYFDPEFNFLRVCKKIIFKLIRWIIGEDAWSFFEIRQS